ncbi:hypothetical protein B0T10DRAFT_499771 [Thelonectria olida]|uniref:Uncharacterized protein n=1 Tax=Thelonectria olida TaxID=1576542 RepID=A0A9P8VS92_9HYPO|nr:hypothetical protein B0T10DRAFT_499771 [Thelonectria olida]
MGLLALVILYPYGNLKAIDAYFFGASASTESGLNTIDVKDLQTYQQVYLWFIPIFTNLGFINAIVVIVRLFWFRKHLNQVVAPDLLRRQRQEAACADFDQDLEIGNRDHGSEAESPKAVASGNDAVLTSSSVERVSLTGQDKTGEGVNSPMRITFDPSTDQHPRRDVTLYIPPPHERDQGPLRKIVPTGGLS